MDVVMVGPFGLHSLSTMRARALPMAKALARRGHRVSVLLPPWRNREEEGRHWREDGVTVENIALPPSIPGYFHTVTALRLAVKALACQPDVIHFFKPKAYSGLAHWLVARIPSFQRPRLVVDSDDWEGPGGWNELGGYTPLQQRFFRWQERWGLTHADGITVASRTLESLVWAMGVPPESVAYVPNGVRDWRRGGERECERGACILLYTRFFEFPVSRVIEVFQRVRKKVPRAHLLVVGQGLFGEEDALLSLASDAGLRVVSPSSPVDGEVVLGDGDVTYAGWVPRDALPSCFARADVAIYPFDDTLVNRTKCAAKLLDLLAAGVPVVAEAVGENRAYIRSGQTGLLVRSGDASAFANAVVEVLCKPQLGRALGEGAAREVRERFGWDRLIEGVLRVYEAR